MPYHPPIPNQKSSGRPSGLFSALIQAEKMIQIAFVLPCAAFIGWVLGDWAGHRIHQVWPAAVGVVFGGAAGLVYVIRLAMNALNDPGNADAPAHADTPSKAVDDTAGKGSGGKRP